MKDAHFKTNKYYLGNHLDRQKNKREIFFDRTECTENNTQEERIKTRHRRRTPSRSDSHGKWFPEFGALLGLEYFAPQEGLSWCHNQSHSTGRGCRNYQRKRKRKRKNGKKKKKNSNKKKKKEEKSRSRHLTCSK
jgi:hypothetical protein